MVDHSFDKTQVDHYDGGDSLILVLYVDDMLIVGQDPNVDQIIIRRTSGERD